MNKDTPLSWHDSSKDDSRSYDPESVFQAGMRHFQIANTAYPINHSETLRPYQVGNEKIQEYIERVWGNVKDLLLYAHVPFCEHICAFCELSVVKPKYITQDTIPYFQALQKEMELYAGSIGGRKRVHGFDIGGGTPSIVDTRYIGGVIDTVDRLFDLVPGTRMSIETTPKIASREEGKISDYHRMGIRRISMGIQSLTGKIIGRADTSRSYNIRAAENIRKAGFGQFNVDIMYGFAEQDDAEVEATLRHVLNEVDPDFITLYAMRYKGTSVEGNSKEVQSKKLTRQYALAYQILMEAGYDIRPGKNTSSKIPGNDGLSDYLHHRVLHGMPYLGFGLGAQSFQPKNTITYNHGAHIKHNAEYIRQVNAGKFPIQDAHHLSREAAMGKMIAISFFYGGIHLESFQKVFGVTLEEAFPRELAYIMQNELMFFDRAAGILSLTKKGVENSSGVISLFYSPATKGYLLSVGEDWKGRSFSIRDISR